MPVRATVTYEDTPPVDRDQSRQFTLRTEWLLLDRVRQGFPLVVRLASRPPRFAVLDRDSEEQADHVHHVDRLPHGYFFPPPTKQNSFYIIGD